MRIEEIFVPGRLCLFGEHSDWAGGYRSFNPSLHKGYALIAGTNQVSYGITKAAVNALQLGDAQQIGMLMKLAQAKFDHYLIRACPHELTAPILHKLRIIHPFNLISGVERVLVLKVMELHNLLPKTRHVNKK